MSTEATDRGIASRARAPKVAVAIASALVFAVFAIVTLVERGPDRVTLRAIAPDGARPGAEVPLGARAFEHRGASLVHELTDGGIEARLLDGDTVAWEGALDRRVGPQFSATAIAPGRPGEYTLEFSRGGAVARRPLAVREGPSRAPRVRLPEELRPEVTREEGDRQLFAEVRVGSGACVPEFECEVFVVHEGREATLVPLRGASADAAPAAERGVSGFGVRVRGLAAEVRVEIVAGDRRRTLDVSLPVASGGVRVGGAKRLLRPGERLELEVESLSAGPHVVTHHLDGELVEIGAARGTFALEELSEGVHRVQVGGDLFAPSSLARAGAFVFVVGPQGAEREGIEGASTRESGQPSLRARMPSPGASELVARAALATLEGERLLPPASSAGARAKGEADVGAARLVGAAIIALLGAWVAWAVVGARRRERRELAEAGGSESWAKGDGALAAGAWIVVVYLLAAAALLSRFWIFG